jgi:hypothetical protein
VATSDSVLGLEWQSNRSSVVTCPTDADRASLGISAAERSGSEVCQMEESVEWQRTLGVSSIT